MFNDILPIHHHSKMMQTLLESSIPFYLEYKFKISQKKNHEMETKHEDGGTFVLNYFRMNALDFKTGENI